MNLTIRKIFAMLLFIVALPAKASIEHLILDNTHSYVRFSIQHLGFSLQTGKWYVNGKITIDTDNPEKSQVEATIKIADLVTGLSELDEHLKGKLFFDQPKFPIAVFKSNKVKIIDKNSANVEGMLTLHGITKPVTLKVTLNKIGKNPFNHRMTAGFTATTIIKRSDFDINSLETNLSDKVEIDIGAEAYQA